MEGSVHLRLAQLGCLLISFGKIRIWHFQMGLLFISGHHHMQEKGHIYGLTNSTIDNMLSTYGVCIWHDYWADNSSDFLNYYYVRSQPYMINATFDSLLTNISAQKQAGKLWNPTVSQYIDYWIAARNVEVRCTGVNTYTVVNHNSGTVNGFSMRVKGAYTPKLDGVTLSTKTNGEDTIFWMNLPTGTHTITLEA